MRISTLGKLAALSLLAIVTWVATSKVISITKASQLQAGDDSEPMSTTVVTRAGDPPAGQPGRKPVRSGSINQFEASVQGRTVHVQAKATIQDGRPGMQFIWAVRAFALEDEDTVLFETLYTEQVFTLDGDQPLETTFEDQVELPLPAGRYKFVLTWFSLPPEQGLAGLSDPNTRERYKGAEGAAVLEIGL